MFFKFHKSTRSGKLISDAKSNRLQREERGGRGEEEEEEGQLAIFHRTQTWHLKCRSSTIVEIVEIVEIWRSARNLVETSRVLGAQTT